jgi:hypothetical protein
MLLRNAGIGLISNVDPPVGVTVSLAAIGQTTVFTVPPAPSTKRFALLGFLMIGGENAGASVITAGQVGALTDFLPAYTLSNVDANYDGAWLLPVISTTPAKIKSYAPGTVIQIDVTTALGGAAVFFPFGFLY